LKKVELTKKQRNKKERALNRRNILKIRCSDGRSRKPDYIRGNFIHEIRLPGGILFPDLCAQQFKKTVVSKLLRRAVCGILRRVMVYAIDIMVNLKAPDEIILMAHTPCGAAQVINLSEEAVKTKHLEWQNRLQKRFPTIPVIVLFEKHSECGEHHEGYEHIAA
jgi:hypothetical protein